MEKVFLKLNFTILCVLVVLFQAYDIYAQSNAELNDQAYKAYAEKRYQEAQKLYQTLLTNEADNPHLYYNLGNVYFKLNQLAKSRQFYEKAKLQLPRSKDLQQNYNLLIKKLGFTKVSVAKDSFYHTFYFWHQWLNEFEYQILMIAFLLVTIVFFSIQILTKKKRFPLRLIIICAFYLYLVIGHQLFDNVYGVNQFGIVLNEETSVRAQYLESAAKIFSLEKGRKVKIIDQQYFSDTGLWLRIENSENQKGWVSEKFIGVI